MNDHDIVFKGFSGALQCVSVFDIVCPQSCWKFTSSVTAASRCRFDSKLHLSHPAKKTVACHQRRGNRQISAHIPARHVSDIHPRAGLKSVSATHVLDLAVHSLQLESKLADLL